MLKRCYILLFCSLAGCTWLTPKEALREQYVSDQLKEIDWESLDMYPLFTTCDERLSKPLQKDCFEKLIKTRIHGLVNTLHQRDSLFFSGAFAVNFKVDARAMIEVQEIVGLKASQAHQMHFIKLIQEALTTLPSLSPAVKQGVPVGARFQIPVEIHLD